MLSIFKFFREINIIFNLMAKTKQKTYSSFYYPTSTFFTENVKENIVCNLEREVKVDE